MFTLETLGGLSLRGANGPITSRAGQRRRLALLALLAAERRPISRDKLLAFLWPEADGERARHLLADSLYVLRSGLGEDAVQTFGDDVSLNVACIASDVAAFLAAVDGGEFEQAVASYTGPFLDGIFISEAPEFERWAESTRSRLEAERRRCLERLAIDAGGRDDHTQAVKWWRALAGADPVSSRAAVGLIRALSAAGDRAAALQFARVHEEIVRAELDSPPDPSVAAAVADLRLASDQPTPVASAPRANAAPHDSAAAADPIPESRTAPSPGTPLGLTPVVRANRRVLVVAVVAVGLIAASAVLIGRARTTRGLQPAGESSRSAAVAVAPRKIAVLPFDSASSDREVGYIANSLTEELTVALGYNEGTNVVPSTSASVAKASRLPLPTLGRMLGVAYFVNGSVRLMGNALHITLRLVDAKDGHELWSDNFIGEVSSKSTVKLEAQIARSLAETLHVRLAEGLIPRLQARTPSNDEALEAYRRGRSLWKTRNPEQVRLAVGYFNQAIRKDSTFAPAHAGLADAYASFAIGNIGDYRAGDYFLLARGAAINALRLDDTLGDAHASLGYIKLLFELDWKGAEQELALAKRLEPLDATPFIYHAILLEWMGQFKEAIDECKEALAKDGLSNATNTEMGRAYFFAGQDSAAVEQLRSTLDLDPRSFRGHMYLGQVLAHQQHFDEAILELQNAVRLSPNSSRPIALLSHAYAAQGKRADATKMLDSLRARRQRGADVPEFDFAIAYAGLGDIEHAISSLNASIDDHSIRPYLMDPTFDGIRADRRFRALLARLRVPTTAPSS